MKIYIGGYGTCGCHHEKQELINLIGFYGNDKDVYLTENVEDADLIVFIDTCVSTIKTIECMLGVLNYILNKKKSNAEVLVSGCLAYNVKFKYPNNALDILNKTTIVPSSKIIEYVLSRLNIMVSENHKLETRVPYSFKDDIIMFSPCSGCPNHCSFCKSLYVDYTPKSISLDDIKLFAQDITTLSGNVLLEIASSNFTTYGIDLYGKQRAHEVISILSEPSNVQGISCGALINFYPELIDEILKNKKVKDIFTSLETGSESLYNTMHRPISLNDWISVVNQIRKKRPDILIRSEIIAGYPGETADDVAKTINLIKELGIYVPFVWPYLDSPYLFSHTLPQHGNEYIDASRKTYVKRLERHNEVVLNKYNRDGEYNI